VKRTLVQSIAIYAAGLLLAAVTLGPMVWLFIMSIMEPPELLAVPLKWLPQLPDLSRYARLLGFTGEVAENPFLNALRNSLIASGGASLLALTVSALAAYSFTRRKAPTIILMLMLATFMMPPITYILPLTRCSAGSGCLITH